MPITPQRAAKALSDLYRDAFTQMAEAKRKINADKVATVWPRSLKTLEELIFPIANTLEKHVSMADHLLVQSKGLGAVSEQVRTDIALIEQLRVFVAGITYAKNDDGTISFSTNNSLLERQLRFGTRDLPMINPLARLAKIVNGFLDEKSKVIIKQATHTHEEDRQNTEAKDRTEEKSRR